jgi:AcrR family transcriptional regulator
MLMNALPSSEINATEQKILDAAIGCVRQWGVAKTSLNDIAKAAGVTRPTVYSYFSNRDEVIKAALLQSGMAFAARLLAHIEQYPSAPERLLEAIAFGIEQLPNEPYLAVITRADLAGYLSKDALNDANGQQILAALFHEIFKYQPIASEELVEVIEHSTRMTLSLLIITGPIQRGPQELRAFLRRRVIAAVNFSGEPGSR